MFTERSNFTELNQIAEEAKRRAEIARYDVFFIMFGMKNPVFNRVLLRFYVLVAGLERCRLLRVTLSPW